MPIQFFRSIGQGLRGHGHMFEKGDDEREKQTNKKSEILTIIKMNLNIIKNVCILNSTFS